MKWLLPALTVWLLLSAAYAHAAQPAYTGGVTVEALPNRVINGGAVTLCGRLLNPGGEAVDEAGFYVGGGSETQRIVCARSAEELSGASVDFAAEASLPGAASCRYWAFARCGGEEVVSAEVEFDGRAPLPAPVTRLRDGAAYTAEELSLTWDAVGGAALYGVTLRDTGSGKYLLGREGKGDDACYWVEGGATSVPPDAYQSRLAAGRTYRLTVYAAYDRQSLFGRSLEFTVVSASGAASAEPSAETGLYCKNGDGTVTLYGSVDGGGRPLAQYGFYVGKTADSMEKMPVEQPEEYAAGAISLTVPLRSGTLYYRAFASFANGVERAGELRQFAFSDRDPFEPQEKTAELSKSYVKLLEAIDPGWQFRFVKSKPYNYANTEIDLLDGWEREHILKKFPFAGKAVNINRGAQAQYGAAAGYLEGTAVKVIYNDGSGDVASFLLKDLVETAVSYNSRYIYPSTADGNGRKLMPGKWSWRLSLHSWGVSVDVNAAVPVNLQKGINFSLIRGGAVKLKRLPGVDEDGAVVFTYDGAPAQGKLVPDDALNCILYELAFKPAGFYWGAYFGNNRTDAMHFTLIEVPAKPDIPLQEAPEAAHE